MTAIDIRFAAKCERIHQKAVEHWQDGKSVEVWKNECGILCITYESGRWWHYKQEGDGSIVWW